MILELAHELTINQHKYNKFNHMFLQSLKTGFRILIRERIYSILNIIGLSVGITVALIIFLYLQDDLTYDRYHRNAKNIYRVNSIYNSSGKENKFAMAPTSFGPRIMEEFPEVKSYTRLINVRGFLSSGSEKFFEENLFIADTGIFDIFTHNFIYGEPSRCLSSPNSIVISEKLSRKYFKERNPVGSVLMFNTQSYVVTGVIKDLPENVHARYDALIPVNDPKGKSKNDSFYDIRGYTYLLFPDNYDESQFYEKFPAFYEKFIAASEKILNQKYKPVIQPLLKIHFSKEWTLDLPNGNEAYIRAFLVIGLLVLSLSCINYLNLTTARAERRRKEISIKKILGSKRSKLISQFLVESMIMSVIAMIIALGMAQFILGFTSFNTLIDKNLQIGFGDNLSFLAGIILLTILVGLASGLYPAFYLSNVHTLKSIQGSNKSGISAASFRKILVITQMIISTGVIICTLLVSRQIDFVRKKDLGLSKENLLIVPLRDTAITNHLNTLKEKLSSNREIISICTAHDLPGGVLGNNLYRAETENGMEENNFFTMIAGYDYLKTMGIKLLKGRDFDRSYTSEPRSAFLINETLAKKMGWNDPLGKRLQQRFGPDGKPFFDGVVIGVVKDFNYASLHNAIEPLAIRVQSIINGSLLVKISGNNVPGTMKFIEKTWNELSTGFPTDYSFLDKNFDKLYKKDLQQNMLIKIFSWICIFVSFLGLLSLSAYITKNRTREIAIRKVYGASAVKVTLMLFREILMLVIIASVIASPLAYWLTSKLLDNFAYKVGFSLNIFLYTISGAILLAVGTVSYHSFKASYLNPAQFLKYE
jgi:putative ABC transport system permease protein